MAACNICVKKINRNQVYIVCSNCDLKFHGFCVDMSDGDISYLKQENKEWICSECQSLRRKSMVLEQAADEGQLTLADIVKILNDIRADNKKMEKNLGKSIDHCHEAIDEVVKRLDVQEKLMNEYKEKMESYETEIKALKLKNEELENRLTDIEQYSRANCLEIHGIPYSPTENVEDIVVSVGEALGCQINKNLIEACHRLGKRSGENKSSPIIVKFIKRNVKEDILQKRRVKRDFSTRHMNLQSDMPVYINESLCPVRRAVFYEARRVKNEKGYKYLWIRNGKILIRKTDGSQVIDLRNIKDVHSLK